MAESEERRGPGFWFIAAGIFVAIVLVGGAVFGGLTYFLGPKDSNAEPQPEESSVVEFPTAQESDAGAVDQGGKCDVPSEDQAYPVEAPETTWEMYENVVMVPTSETFGPTKREGKFWQCYAHSPTGALFATVNLSMVFLDGGIKEAAVPSVTADDMFAQEQEAKDNGGGSSTTPSGYQFLEYTDQKATIDLLFQDGDYVGTMRLVVVWVPEAADWRLDWEASDTDFTFTGIDPADYVTWEP